MVRGAPFAWRLAACRHWVVRFCESSVMILPRRILHVDDDPEIIALVAEHLREYGYQTQPIHDPSLVMRRLARSQERVVLLDIDMPGTDGLRLLQEVKEFDGAVQVVMLTGLATMTTVLQSLRLGAEACFFKPIVDVEPLVGGLEACFQKIERWWATLDDLSRRRNAECRRPAASAGALSAQVEF